MATVIKLKRGTTTPTTSDLANGEVGIDTSAKKFYINDSGTIKEIGGGTSSSGDSSSPLSGDVRGYTGDGSTVAYTVTSGADVENLLVFVNGVFQRPTTDFTVSGTTLTFGTAPVSGDAITIKELVEGQNTFNDNPVVRAYTGDGSTTGFTVSSNKTVDQFLVFLNGVFQRPTTDFSYSGTTLTFGTAPVNDDVISIKELAESAGNLLTIVDDTSTTTAINQGESLKISGGTNITTSLTGDTLTINGPDLSSYLTSETNDLSSNVTWANVPDANITESSVTQHQAALSITESQISDLQSYLTSSSITVVDDSSTSTTISNGETLKVAGSGGVTTSLSGDTLTISGAAQLTVQEEGSSLSTAASTLNFVGDGVTATGTGATKTITISGSSVDLTAVSTDITPDTHNSYDVGQLGSAFRDFTFVRKVQKNVEIFTNALGLGTVATNLGFNINTSAANFTQVYTNAGGLDSPVLGGGSATFDDNNPAFLF